MFWIWFSGVQNGNLAWENIDVEKDAGKLRLTNKQVLSATGISWKSSDVARFTVKFLDFTRFMDSKWQNFGVKKKSIYHKHSWLKNSVEDLLKFSLLELNEAQTTGVGGKKNETV